MEREESLIQVKRKRIEHRQLLSKPIRSLGFRNEEEQQRCARSQTVKQTDR